MKKFVRHTSLLVSLMLIATISGCSTTTEKIDIYILNAGSLVIPMKQLEKAFEELHQEIDIRYEGHGSIQVVRHITELGDLADVAFVADYSLLPLLMYPAKMEDGNNFADWHIQFANNQLGIAYTPESAYTDEINKNNWYDILGKDDVNVGFSDPRLDAVGYRTLMLLQLAEDHYGESNIFDEIITANFNSRIRSVKTDDSYYITVPELLESTNGRIYLRGFSVQLLALLESNQIDYAFEYKSVALQHGLKFLELPDEIDLSNESMADNYGRVTVKLDYNRYQTVNPVFEGLPIIYGVTIPNSAPHPEEAALFIEFLLGAEGHRILEDNYQPPIIHARTDNISSLPEELKILVK